MSSDRDSHKRTIYGVWDFLGDVGGLFDMLRLIALHIISLSESLFGNGLSRYLIAALFKTENKKRGR